MIRPNVRRSLLVAALGGGVLLGCRVSRDNPEHCFHAEGNATCLERYPDGSLPYCAAAGCGDAAYGCVDEAPGSSCYSPCGGGALLGEGECEIADESETETETDESPDLPPQPECALDSDCLDQEGTRFCVDGSCQPCSSTPDPSLACASRDPALPVCHEDECVTCFGDQQQVCAAQSQVCLPDETSCGPCTDHDQCAGGAACDILAGTCFPEDAVWHIDLDGGQNFKTITDAMASLGPSGSATFILHAVSFGLPYDDDLQLDDKRVALLAAPGEKPWLEPTHDDSGVRVLGASRLYLRGVRFEIDRALVIAGESAVAYVEASEFYAFGIMGPSIEITDDAHLVMRNSFVGGYGVTQPMLETRTYGSFDISYSTFVGITEVALRCTDVPKLSTLRNSLFLGLDNETFWDCSTIYLTMNDNALTVEYPSEPDNVVVGEPVYDWFVDSLGDLHLTDKVPLSLSNAGEWKPGDPTTDIDGDPRVAEPNASGWAGADVPNL